MKILYNNIDIFHILAYNINKSVIEDNNNIFIQREFVVGVNDNKNLFIYFIDEAFTSGVFRYKNKLIKGWYRAFSTPWYYPFYILERRNIMIDTHYDLLTILYCCYMKNDFTYINKLKSDLKDVKGLIANLYFMNKKEMKEELEIENIDVFEMFKISTNLFKQHFKDKKVVFSIEGCDYIKDTNELEDLYKLGLRNILLVWNNENKYGSGNKTNKDLTELGKQFIEKAVSLGICINLSHMNKNTFWDTIRLLNKLKSEGKHPKVMASHSNSYSLCPHPRNLNDEQLEAIKALNGIVGIVGHGPFINKDEKDLEKNYLEHIKYIEQKLGINNIAIATDNINFSTELFGLEVDISLLNHHNIKKKLTNLLSNYYNKEEQEKILFKNIEKFFEV